MHCFLKPLYCCAGNLIRTPDGRICILDFGLMTEVPPERAQALVEYIAHLSVEDFEAVVMHDLPALGFIPPGAVLQSVVSVLST